MPRSAGLAFDDDGNPAITYRADSAVKMVYYWPGDEHNPPSWLEETLCNDPDCQGMDTPSLVYDPVRGDFSVASDDSYWVFTCDRHGDAPDNWQCGTPFLGAGGHDGIISNHRRQDVWMGSEMLVVDPFGELFLAHNAEYFPDRVLARRPLGSPLWTHEFVDHPSTRGLPPDEMGGGGPGGPFVALDRSYRPTLTWTWNLGHFLDLPVDSPSEYHLYFAWKGTP